MTDVSTYTITTKDGDDDRLIVAERYEERGNEGVSVGVSASLDITDYLSNIVDKLNELNNKIDSQTTQLSEDIQSLETEFKNEMDSNRSTLSDEMKTTRDNFSDEMKTTRDNFSDEMKTTRDNFSDEMEIYRDVFEKAMYSILLYYIYDAFRELSITEASGFEVTISEDEYEEDEKDRFKVGDLASVIDSDRNEVIPFSRVTQIDDKGDEYVITLDKEVGDLSGGILRISSVSSISERGRKAIQNAAFDVSMEQADKVQDIKDKIENPIKW